MCRIKESFAYICQMKNNVFFRGNGEIILNNINYDLRITLISFLCILCSNSPSCRTGRYVESRCKSNGKTLNTKLINTTIDRLSRGGGGTLFFPAGTYLTGSIHMKSNITLELEAGATLLFSDNFDDYLPFVEVRHEGVM